MTRQLRKHGVLAIALIVVFALVFACVGVAAINGNSKAALAQGETVTFQVAVTGDTIRYVDSTHLGTVTVNYVITQNDGFNSMLLIPSYDSSVFSIAFNSDITISDVLGAPTITQEGSNGVKKILIENTGDAYAGTDSGNSVFLTIVYTIIAPTAGNYSFGLDLTTAGENNKSVAYYIQGGEQKGEQNEVKIISDTDALTLIALEQPVITIGYNRSDGSFESGTITKYYQYEFGKAAVQTADVASMSISHPGDNTYEALEPSNPAGLKVYYTFKSKDVDLSGVQDAPSVSESWFYYDNMQSAWVAMPNNVAPSMPGTYKVTLSSPAQTKYLAAQASAIVVIVPRQLVVYVPDKTSAYGDPIVALEPIGPLNDAAICNGDQIYINVVTTATSTSVPGKYDITASVETDDNTKTYNYIVNNPYGDNNMYNVVFRRVYGDNQTADGDAVYTITGKQLTLTALNQSASYTGFEPTVDKTKYTLKDANGNSYASLVDGTTVQVRIAKEAGVDKGNYELTPSILGLNGAYTVTVVNGTFTITAADVAKAHFTPYFEGLNKVFNRSEQDLLAVTKPAAETWWRYTASNNLQTNVNSYVITVTITVDSNHNYTGEDNPIQLTVNGSITPKPVTLTAGNVSKLYGQDPSDPTITCDDEGANLNYSYVIKDNGETFVPSKTTNVGVYDIVLSESNNSNYNVTLVNGTYTISKATATASVNAADVYYNRALKITSSASVNAINLEPTITYYNSNEQALAGAPVNAGTYKVVASVEGNYNYNGASAEATFEIFKVKLPDLTFNYSGDHGNVTWTALTSDIGKISTETGVDPLALKEGTTVTYVVYDGESIVKAESSELTFDALSATTGYYVKAIPSNDNYLPSETALLQSFAVSFAKGTPDPDGAISNLPDTQFVFAGQHATAPQTNPSVPHNVFNKWQLNSADYSFESAVNSDIELVALWNPQTYTVTLKYLSNSETTSGAKQDVFVINNLVYGDTVNYSSLGIAPVKSSSNPGISYVFDNKWTDESSVEHGVENDAIQNYTVSGNMTFVAVFRKTYNSFTVSYWFTLKTDATGYGDAAAFERSFAYGEAIDYSNNLQAIAWFVKDGWYADAERTVDAPATMPNANLNVYMGLKFDIGKGDVNADGLVNADDITLYRKWIVGGYEMEVINAGDEWATASNEQFDSSKTYFLKGVADGNLDNSRDIRDVSIIRMAVAGGYNWEIFTGEDVSGGSLARIKTANSIANLLANLNGNYRTILYGEGNEAFTDKNLAFSFSGSTHIYIDLDGHDLTVKSLNITSSGRNAVVTIKNGKIYSMGGITISAPRGTVILDNVIGYVNNNPVNLQAASHSLHFANVVEFYDLFAAQPTIAPIHVEENTHVVVEAAAQIKIEKIIVTENSFQQVAEQSEAAISLLNKTETAIAVEDNRVVRSEGVAAIGGEVYPDLVSAIQAINASATGGTITLLSDLDFSEKIYAGYEWGKFLKITQSNVTLDLNGHTIRNMGNAALCAGNLLAANGRISNFTIKNGTLRVGQTDGVNNSYALAIAGVDGALIKNVTTFGGINVCTGSEDVVIENCTVQGTKYYTVCAQTGSHVTIKGSTLTKNTDSTVANKSMFWIQGAGTDSDTVTSSNPTGAFDASSITIESGNFNVDTSNGGKFYLSSGKKPIVKGGSFNIDPTAYVAEGFAVSVGNNVWTVGKAVARIGDKLFASLDAAAAAAQPGDTVVLLQDITYGEDRSVAIFDPGFALNLNGHTVTTNSTVSVTLSNNGYQASAICFATYDASSISNGTIVTAYGAGLYAAATTCTLDNVTINANTLDVQATSEYSSAIRITTAGTVIINSGSYTGYNAIAVSNSGGAFVINGGTFNGRIFFSTGTDSGKTKSITINGGTFNGEFVNPNKGTLVIRGGSFDHDPTAYLAEGYVASYSNGIWTVDQVEGAARIGNQGYASFEAAVTAAQPGDTVVLLQDITYGEDRSVPVWTSKVFNIDLNGHTFTTNSNVGTTLGNNGYTASAICFSNANAGSNLTISNGTIVTAYGAGVYADDPGMAITFEDLTINAAQVGTQSTAEYSAGIRLTCEATAIIKSGSYSGAYALAVSNSGGIAIINGGEFHGGIFFSTDTTSGKTKSITINGGTFYGEFVNPNKGNLVINAGTFDHDPTAYVAEGSIVSYNGSVWTVSALEGLGTQESPYLINNLAELEGLRDSVNNGNDYAGKFIKLMANIELNDGWTPIGEGSRKVVSNSQIAQKYTGNAFAGNFDGNNKTISNLNNNRFVPSEDRMVNGNYAYGLFALTDTGANIHDLTLSNVAINAATGDSVAALVGFSAGSLAIDNVIVSGSISAEDGVGGIVGRAYDQNDYAGNETVSVTNCVNNADITASSASGNKASGIIGFAGEAPHAGSTNTVTISGCTNNGSISGALKAGIACYSYEGSNASKDNSLQNYVFSNNTNNDENTSNKYATANSNPKHANETISIDE